MVPLAAQSIQRIVPRVRHQPALAWLLLTCAACANIAPAAVATSQPSQRAPTAELAPASAESKGDGSEPISLQQRQAQIPYTRFAIPIDDAPARGAATAPVTIVMFSDFECPFCLQGFATVEAIESEFAGQIRLVYRAFPISRHPNAMLAALLAASAHARGQFWPFHRQLFSGEKLAPERLWRDIENLGLSRKEIEAEVDHLRFGPTLSADLRLAKRFDVTSTPTFFVNGRPLAGSLPLAAFRHIVEQELRVAQSLVGRGVQPNNLYHTLTEHGFGGVSYEGSEGADLDPDHAYPVAISDSPQLGPDTAPVTIALFTDFECPYCVRGNAVIDRLRARYGNQLRLVFKNLPLPFHRAGQAAARLGVVAQRHQKFWAYHDALMHLDAGIDRRALEAIAIKIGLPPVERDAALDDTDPVASARVSQDLDLALMLGINGTPAYFINGRPISGARDELEVRLVITQELLRAEALIKQGMPAQRVYEHLTQVPATSKP